MLELKDGEERVTWVDSLNAPLDGESRSAVLAEGFDDSFNQIRQQ